MSPEQIRGLRERFGLTQAEFAARLGLETRGAVSKLEKGRKAPKGPLLKLLEALAAGGRRGKGGP